MPRRSDPRNPSLASPRVEHRKAQCPNKRGPRGNSVKPAAVGAFEIMTKSVANTVTVLVIFSTFACA